MIQGEAWYMIRELLREGLSVSEIARRTGCDRKTAERAASWGKSRSRAANGDAGAAFLQVAGCAEGQMKSCRPGLADATS